MNPRTITVQLEIDPDNAVRLLSGPALESRPFEERTTPPPKAPPFDVPFDATYNDRNGYVPDLLGSGAKVVHLPTLGAGLKKLAVPLLAPAQAGDVVLNYYNYSVVMHGPRRMAIYSAASLRGDQRHKLSRKEYSDDPWKPDPRIPISTQITDFYYRGNQFDRGHLSRNEDLEFGPSQMAAMQSAIDTCHYTNCVPQHQKFNRGTNFWQGIERHILEQSIDKDNFHAQAFTGPILEEDDPVYEKFPKIQYPVRFWKVVAALDARNKLFATAYILDQSEVIADFGLDEAAREIPFGAFKTFQVKIAEVERLTGLSFTSGTSTSLQKSDPLDQGAASSRPRRRRLTVTEGTMGGAAIPPGYRPLIELEDIVTSE